MIRVLELVGEQSNHYHSVNGTRLIVAEVHGFVGSPVSGDVSVFIVNAAGVFV